MPWSAPLLPQFVKVFVEFSTNFARLSHQLQNRQLENVPHGTNLQPDWAGAPRCEVSWRFKNIEAESQSWSCKLSTYLMALSCNAISFITDKSKRLSWPVKTGSCFPPLPCKLWKDQEDASYAMTATWERIDDQATSQQLIEPHM